MVKQANRIIAEACSRKLGCCQIKFAFDSEQSGNNEMNFVRGNFNGLETCRYKFLNHCGPIGLCDFWYDYILDIKMRVSWMSEK